MSPPWVRPPHEAEHLACEPPEALLSWPPMVRYLDARILQAVRPWARLLYSEDFAEFRRRAYLELSLDPVLRGLVTQLARELGRGRKGRRPGLASSPPRE